MIPGVLVDFLERASVALGSTRDENYAPHLYWLSGWSVGEDRETVACLVAASFTEALMATLTANGHFAMVAERIGPHETYQFKGRYVDSRAATALDRPVFLSCRERYVADVKVLFGSRFTDQTLRDRFREPAIVVRFRVAEIYLQTPGPDAGRRIFPEG